MGKGKLSKFAENETFKCLVQPPFDAIMHSDDPIKGRWNEIMFASNGAPIVVELGCGKGEYTLDLARRRPQCNYIGVDIKGARLWRGAKTATEESLSNVAFLRTRIEFINSIFAEDEVSEIWVTFCDPQPKKPNKRLTSPPFLDRYRKFLKKGGAVHLKTDSRELYDYTSEVVAQQGLTLVHSTPDLYSEERGVSLIPPEVFEVRTFYEKMFLAQGKPITYMKFIL